MGVYRLEPQFVFKHHADMTDLRKGGRRQTGEVAKQSHWIFKAEQDLAEPNRPGFLIYLTTDTKDGEEVRQGRYGLPRADGAGAPLSKGKRSAGK